MKNSFVSLFAVILGAFVMPGVLRAQAQQIEASIEIYEMPNASAFAVQKVFATGTDAERKMLAQQMREKKLPAGLKTLAILKGAGAAGSRLSLGTPADKRYATEFIMAGASPTAYQTRKVGWMAQLEATKGADAIHYDIAASVEFTQEDGSGHFRLTGGGQAGNMEQPYFAGQKCNFTGAVVAGEPRLAAIFTPFREGLPATSLGVIVMTVTPIK